MCNDISVVLFFLPEALTAVTCQWFMVRLTSIFSENKREIVYYHCVSSVLMKINPPTNELRLSLRIY